MPVRLHHILVLAGLIGGVLIGVTVIETDPAFFGWLLGAGAGLAGGAFVAAIVSGESLASGGGERTRSRHRGVNPALRHWEASAPPSANGKHDHHPSEAGDTQRERPE